MFGVYFMNGKSVIKDNKKAKHEWLVFGCKLDCESVISVPWVVFVFLKLFYCFSERTRGPFMRRLKFWGATMYVYGFACIAPWIHIMTTIIRVHSQIHWNNCICVSGWVVVWLRLRAILSVRHGMACILGIKRICMCTVLVFHYVFECMCVCVLCSVLCVKFGSDDENWKDREMNTEM